MNLILVAADEVAGDGRVRLAGTRADHLRNVLRVKPGDRVRVGILNGGVGEGVVTGIGPESVDLCCQIPGMPPASPLADLLLALPRPKVMKRLWAPLAQIGVRRIFLTNAAKVERMYFDTHVLAPAFYRERLLEGLSQARDTRMPEVRIVRRLKAFLEDELDALCPKECRLLADPAAERRIRETLHAAAAERVLLAVGPEGGWTDYERDLFSARGFRAVGAGGRILRTDTACVALLALVYDALA